MGKPFDPYDPRDEVPIEIKILKQSGSRDRLIRQANLRHYMIDEVLVGALYKDIVRGEICQINRQLRELDPTRLGQIRARLQEMKDG